MTLFLKKPSNRRLTLYLPDKDRNGNPVYRHEDWLNEACLLLVGICGGATKNPPSTGYWHNKASGKIITETTHTVASFVGEADLASNVSALLEFLARFATETNQDSIAIEYDGAMHFLSEFDPQPLQQLQTA